MKRCFFIGHSDASMDILSDLTASIRQHITKFGVSEFIVGNYGNFDRLATHAVKTAKQNFPDIKLTLLLPYYPTKNTDFLTMGFDDTLYPSDIEYVPKRLAIIYANRYMVDHSDYLIAYSYYPGSNSRKILEYAKNREKEGLISVCNLYK